MALHSCMVRVLLITSTRNQNLVAASDAPIFGSVLLPLSPMLQVEVKLRLADAEAHAKLAKALQVCGRALKASKFCYMLCYMLVKRSQGYGSLLHADIMGFLFHQRPSTAGESSVNANVNLDQVCS